MRLVVAATAPLGAAVLAGLATRFEVELLVTRPDRPRGRGRLPGPPPAKEEAGRLGVPVIQPERLTEVPGSAPVVIVCAYGLLIPGDLLEERLWLNVHPSLLPRWRGAAPVERALMAGDGVTGVTIHRTTAELDAGPVAAQRSFPIGPDDDAGAVFERTAELSLGLLEELLRDVAGIEFAPQSEEGVTYAERLTSSDRDIDWAGPVADILNRIRALSPHIGARGIVGGRRLIVWKARAAAADSALVEGGVELLEVQPEGRRRMTGAEYLRGVRA